MAIRIALKPKYTTRKATDKVIFNEGNFITVINENTPRHVLSLLDTCHIALVSEDKFYPVDIDTYEEQYKLVDTGETPTVEADEKFGVKKIEEFVTTSESDVAKKLVENEKVVNGVITGTLLKVINPDNIGASGVDKKGFWLAVNVDLAGVKAEGYSELKFMDTGDELVDGENLIYMGLTEEDVAKKFITVVGKLTVDEEIGDVEEHFDVRMTTKVMMAIDDTPAIDVDGVEFDDLIKAFASLNGKGGKVVVNKSIDVKADRIYLKDGKRYELNVNNGAVVTFGANIFMDSGCTLDVTGEGILQEKTPYYGPVIVANLATPNLTTSLTIGKGITMKGWSGTMVNGKSENVSIVCYGKCVGMSDGTDDGAAIYVNGTSKRCVVKFYGSTEGTVGHGMYIAGDTEVTVANAIVSGSLAGIEQRAGKLSISNSRIEGGSGEPTMIPNGNGNTASNAAVAIAQHTTKLPIDVSIVDSTLIGSASFFEGNPQNNPNATEQTNIKIMSGTMIGTVKTLADTDCTGFLYGGRYNEKPEDKFVAKYHEAVENSNGTYEIRVND